MPRVFDPERDDPTVKLIKGVTTFFEEQKYKLSENEINEFIKQMLKRERYSQMVQKYLQNKIEFPDIIIKNSCSKGHFFFNTSNYPFQYFPSDYNQQKNEIILCKNQIRNLLELQENLDRELTLAYDHNVEKKDLSQDADFACSQIRACRVQLDNYKKLDNSSKKQISQTCARFLFRHKGPNQDKLPHDMWVRYTEKILDKFDYCYNLTYPFK
ncbi:hypothetical protein ABPG72_007781 [Tetrahymena utriculariae]